MKHPNKMISLAATLMLAVTWIPASAQSTTLRFGHIQTTSHPHHKAAQYFAEKVNEATDGEVNVEIFPAGQLGGEREMIESIQLGTLDMGLISSSAISNIEPTIGLFDLPYLFTSRQQANEVMDGEVGDALAKRLLERGVRTLGYGDLGFRQISGNHPVESPEDLEGVKIRVPESRVMVQSFQALGAQPVSMAYPEVYLALQQGTIDAEENPLSVIYAGKFHEVNKYISMTSHQYMPMLFVISESVFQSLPDDFQTVLQEVGEETAQVHRRLIKEENERLKAVMADEGVTFVERDDIDIDAMRAATRDVKRQLAESLGIQEFVKEIENGTSQ